MPPKKLRPYLGKLNDIERTARLRFPDCTFLYLYNITAEFVAYFRYLVAKHPDIFHGPMLDALQFYFDTQLVEIFRSKADFQYLAFEVDGQSIWPLNHVTGRYSAWV